MTSKAKVQNEAFVVAYNLPEKNASGLGLDQTTEVFAKDHEELYKVLEQRHMGEHFDLLHTLFEDAQSVELPSELIKAERYAEALHAACWLGMVACKSETATGFELLDDVGLIHCLSHLCLPQSILDMQSPEFLSMSKKRALKEAIRLESIVPGFQRFHK